MSMRRSRIQVKPNLGGRGAKPIERSSGRTADQPASTSKPDVKSPSKGQDKTASPVKTQQVSASSPFKQNDKASKSPCIQNETTSSQKAEVGLSTRTWHSSAMEKSMDMISTDQPASLGLPQGDTTQHNSTTEVEDSVGKTTENFPDKNVVENRVSNRTPGSKKDAVGPAESVTSKTNEDNSTPDQALGQATNSTPAPSASPSAKEQSENPKPKSRGRYGNRAKPNLSDAGRPRSRPSAQKTKPAVEVKKPEISEAREEAKSDMEGIMHSTHIGSPGSVGARPSVGVEPGETVVEVEVAGEEVVSAEGLVQEKEGGTQEEETDDQQVFIPASLSAQPASVPPSIPAITEKNPTVEEETKGHKTAANKPEVPKVRKKPVKVQAPVDQPPDKFKMKMKDLIYWNPTSNPMKITDKEKKTIETDPTTETPQEEGVVPPNLELEEEESLPVPQVKIGPDGSIILNEESLVINNKLPDPSEMSDTNIVDETDSLITYASFRKRHLAKNWGEKETERFFWALSIVGTDFSLMSNLFKRRNRYDLKKKFKREEKYNRPLVDKALLERKTFDMEAFENVTDEDEEEVKPKKRKKKGVKKDKTNRAKKAGATSNETVADEKGEGKKTNKKKSNIKKAGKRGKRRSEYFDDHSDDSSEEEKESNSRTALCDDSPGEGESAPERTRIELEGDEDIGEEDGHRTLAKKDRGHSSDEDEERVLESICQKTRSGRQPKRTSFFNTETRDWKRAKTDNTENDPPVATAGRVSVDGSTGKEAGVQTVDSEAEDAAKTPAPDQSILRRTLPVNLSPSRQSSQSMEIQTVQNMPSAGGGQLVLVTQKGDDSQGQGTVIHVYMLSPTSANRTPDWPRPGQSPRPAANKHVYTVSPRVRTEPFPCTSANTNLSPRVGGATIISPRLIIGASPLRTNTVNVQGLSPRAYPSMTSPLSTNSYSVSPRSELHNFDIPVPSHISSGELGASQSSSSTVSSQLSTDEVVQTQPVDIPVPMRVPSAGTNSEVINTVSEVIMDLHSGAIPSFLSLDPVMEETVTTTEPVTTLEQAVMEAVS